MFRTTILGILAMCITAAEDPVRPRPTTWAQPMLGSGLQNFYKVSDDLYRSEQPDDDAMSELEKAGIKAVLNLREYHSDADEAKGTKIELHRIKMAAGDIQDAQIREALDILRKAPKPVLVHCWHGSDRTGVVVAMYRMAIHGWDRAAAIDEFKHGGYGYHEKWYPNIEAYLQAVDIARFR